MPLVVQKTFSGLIGDIHYPSSLVLKFPILVKIASILSKYKLMKIFDV